MMLGSIPLAKDISKPDIFPLTYPERTADKCEIEWHIVNNHTQGSEENLISPTCPGKRCHDALSQLLRELEYRTETYHTANGRIVTDIEEARNVMVILRPDYNFTEVAYLMPLGEVSSFNQIKAGKIFYVYGFDEGTSNRQKKEHYWLIDGGKKQTTKSWTIDIYGNRIDNVQIDYYLHCNWGDFGKNNGYYRLGVFDHINSQGVTDFDYSSRLRYFTEAD